MKEHRLRATAHSAGATALASLIVGFMTAGCPDDPEPPADAGVVEADSGTPDSGPPPDSGLPPRLGNGQIDSIGPAAQTGVAGFLQPFDSTPSPDGTAIYFIADTLDDGPAIFSVPANGGTVAILHVGDPLATPINIMITTDGTTLFVADVGANDDMDRRGRIFTLPVGGGVPTPIVAADGYGARGLDIRNESGADQVYFTGKDITDKAPGLFKMAANGASISTVLKGDPFSDPSGVAVTSAGVAYVSDTSASPDGRGVIFRLTGGAAVEFVSDLRLAYPAGIAIVQDETAMLVSALDPVNGTSVVYRYVLADGTSQPFSAGIDSTTEPAGLHRAHNADIYSWADANGKRNGPPTQNQGAVYLVKTRLP